MRKWRREVGEPMAPLTRGLFGWKCFCCYRYTWMHRRDKGGDGR